MAVKITYLDRDAFITSKNPNENTGIDEIMSIGSFTDEDGSRVVRRVLVKPKTNQILDLIGSNNITDYEAHLRFRTITVQSFPQAAILYLNAIKTHDDIDWVVGHGKEGDIPQDTSGVSWNSITGDQSTPWIRPSGSSDTEIPFEATASSYNTSGGGTWYSGSNYEYTTSLEYRGYSLDPVIDITEYIKSVEGLEIKDNGLILRFGEELESGDRSYIMNFFSSETNTIFYPTVHLCWDDQVYNTTGLEIIQDNNVNIKVSNSKLEYAPSPDVRFDLHVRPQYPDRKFTTSSIYLENYALPEDTLWALQDYYTGEIVIPFNSSYTKVSCDATGPYVNMDTSALPLERYYRLLIKANINNSELIKSLDIFKISRHG